jgi:ribosomal protein S12 methylthiotransferase accessory factor
VARTPLTEQLAANFASHMIIKAIASGGGAFEGRILTIDLHSLQMQSHEVVRRPQCCRCGVAFPDGDPQIPTLQHRKKRFISDGGHRTISPEETLIRFQKHISPITGIVDKITRIGNIPNQHHQPPLHVYLARHNFAFKFKNMRSFAENMKSQSAGKGKTESQAKASALAEAIERYSAIFTGDEHRIRASLRELGESAIHPNDCMLFSQKQFRERQSDESGTTYTSRIPEPLPEDASLDWTPLYSLSKQRWRYLPTIYLYFPSTIGPTPHSRSSFFYGDSNGNASGNVIEEAILQGFLELLERDCVAIWWYNLARRPAVDLASFQDSVIDELVAAYQSLGREIWALDIRNDFGIPAVAAISRNVAGGPQDVLFGFGAHLDARIAVSRALTEMNQMLTLSEGINDSNGIGRNLDLELSHWFATATVENQPYLLPSDTLAPTRRENYPQLASDDVLADIELCKTIVHSLGMEMLILDQTRPDIDMPAVKVVVPGMRHFWPRFAPGRLYDVPVKLGWWPKALTEEQLNPVRMFF